MHKCYALHCSTVHTIVLMSNYSTYQLFYCLLVQLSKCYVAQLFYCLINLLPNFQCLLYYYSIILLSNSPAVQLSCCSLYINMVVTRLFAKPCLTRDQRHVFKFWVMDKLKTTNKEVTIHRPLLNCCHKGDAHILNKMYIPL